MHLATWLVMKRVMPRDAYHPALEIAQTIVQQHLGCLPQLWAVRRRWHAAERNSTAERNLRAAYPCDTQVAA